MDICRKPNPHTDPIGIPIGDLEAWGGPSRTHAFRLVKAGELESYKIGRARMIRLDSLRQFINRIGNVK